MTKLSVDPPVVSSLLQILHLFIPHFSLHFRLHNLIKIVRIVEYFASKYR